MLLRILEEFEIVGVWERGVPNKERIAIKAKQSVDLSNYLLFLGVPLSDQTAFPLTTDIFWFGKEIVDSGTWVILYTGPGDRKYTKMESIGEPALVLHWGKKTTILNSENIVPVMVSLEGVLVGPHPPFLELPHNP